MKEQLRSFWTVYLATDVYFRRPILSAALYMVQTDRVKELRDHMKTVRTLVSLKRRLKRLAFAFAAFGE